jgi:hypothetical protein
MTDPCPVCGKDRVLVGRAHNCQPTSLTSKGSVLLRPVRVEGSVLKSVSTDVGWDGRTVLPATRRGRARLEDRGSTVTATRPWETAVPKMSRRTWYRRLEEERRREKREGE